MCKKPEAGRRTASLRNRETSAAVRREELAKRQSRGRLGGRALGATLELCPEGTGEPREGPELGKKLGSRASLLPSPLSVPIPPGSAPALSGSFLPSSPGPHAAPPLTAAQASVPLAPPQQRLFTDAAAIFRSPP